MKKQLLAGAASLVVAVAPVFSAFAEAPQAGTNAGDFQGSHDVTVGEVDETVYSVDINWGDLSFDWKYNASNNGYAFLGKDASCQRIEDEESPYLLAAMNNLYLDYRCAEAVEDDISEGSTYYTNVITAHQLKVLDKSVNGRISAKASFASEENYGWVKGVFSDIAMSFPSYIYSSNKFVGYEETDGTLTSKMGTLPLSGEANNILMDVLFHLEPKADAEYDPSSVTAGDTIGTITIDIEPDLN